MSDLERGIWSFVILVAWIVTFAIGFDMGTKRTESKYREPLATCDKCGGAGVVLQREAVEK